MLRLLGLLSLACMAFGCVHYTFNGQPYETAGQLEEAQRKFEAETLARVKPRAQPMARQCRIAVPNRDVVRAFGVLHDDNVSQGTIDVIADSSFRLELFSARIIEKRRICEQTQIELSDGKRVIPKADELVIYLHMPELDTADWYVVRASAKPQIVLIDRRILDNQRRLDDWLQRLEAKITLLGPG
jgi:hypothetical protein